MRIPSSTIKISPFIWLSAAKKNEEDLAKGLEEVKWVLEEEDIIRLHNLICQIERQWLYVFESFLWNINEE
jgi:hypothetical protein